MNRTVLILLLLAFLYVARDHLPLPLFRLPGDFTITTERWHLLIPVTTCLLVSLLVNLAALLLARLQLL